MALGQVFTGVLVVVETSFAFFLWRGFGRARGGLQKPTEEAVADVLVITKTREYGVAALATFAY